MTSEVKKFRSASGQNLRIESTTGHCFTIGKQWKALPESLHALAYKNGCISDDMDAFKEMEGNEVSFALANAKVAEKDALIQVIEDLIEAGDPKSFLKSGKVDATAMTQAYGKTVSAQKRDEMWDKGGFEPQLFVDAEEG